MLAKATVHIQGQQHTRHTSVFLEALDSAVLHQNKVRHFLKDLHYIWKTIILSGCQTNDKVGQFRLPIKPANKKLSSVMQKSAEFVCHHSTKIVRLYCPSRTRSILDEKIAQLRRMPSCDWPTVCLHDKPVISDPRS